MILYNAKQLRKDLIIKRLIDNNMSMQQAAKEIGISKATISRLEKSSIPDVDTFAKVCQWLGEEPNRYFIKLANKTNPAPDIEG